MVLILFPVLISLLQTICRWLNFPLGTQLVIKMSDSAELTVEQQAFLEECQVEFANRFSNEDKDYKQAYERGISTPPVMSPWYGRPRFVAKRPGQGNYQGRQDRDHYEPRYSRNDRRDDGNRRYKPY